MSLTIQKRLVTGEETSLVSVVMRPGVQFKIPYNQRPWSWREGRLKDLWKDLKDTLDAFYEVKRDQWVERSAGTQDRPHFFGAFVLVELETDSAINEVVDGQQRLTAVVMLAAALRAESHRLSQSQDADLRDKASRLKTTLTGWLETDGDPGEFRPRLLVDSQYQPLFEEYIIKPVDQDSRDAAFQALPPEISARPSHRHLKKSFDVTTQWVKQLLENQAEKTQYSLLVALSNSLGKAFRVILVTVKEEAFSYKVFKCLNARGQALTDVDNIKNELFTRTPRAQHGVIKDDWDEIASLVPDGDVARFLRYRHLGQFGECPQNALYLNVLSKELEQSDAPSLVKDWLKDAKKFRAVCTFNDKSVPKTAQESLRCLNETLGISYSWIFLLSAARKFLPKNPTEFSEAAQLALNFCFRFLTVGKSRTGMLEERMAEAARALEAGKTLRQVRLALRKHSPNAKFESDFSKASETRSKVQYHVLFEIERHLSGGKGVGLQPYPQSPRQHIEHVMPQHFSTSPRRSKEWRKLRSQMDKHRLHINRYGNLCILEGDINGDVSNYEFIAKQTGRYPAGSRRRKCYKNSKLCLAQELASTSTYKGWDFNSIGRRQEHLAKLACKVWSV